MAHEDVAHLQLRYAESGIRAYIHVSWLDPCKVRRVTVVGSEKMVVYNDLAPEGKIRIYDVGLEENINGDSYGEPVKYRRGDIVSPHFSVSEPLVGSSRAHDQLHPYRRDARAPTVQSGLAVARVLEAADTAHALRPRGRDQREPADRHHDRGDPDPHGSAGAGPARHAGRRGLEAASQRSGRPSGARFVLSGRVRGSPRVSRNVIRAGRPAASDFVTFGALVLP